jgi:hypothetical protein
MEIKYALLNPADGQYEMFNTEDEVKQELAKRALAFYISHAHGVAYSKVTVDENGWEEWAAVDRVKETDFDTLTKNIQEQI